MRAGRLLLALASWWLAACGGGTAAHPDGAVECADDSRCPAGQVCRGGHCVDPGPPDAADDAPPGAPQLFVTPTLLNYNDPLLGGVYAGTLTVRNLGQSPLTIRQLDLEDHTPGHDFRVSAPPRPFALDPANG